MSIDVRKKTGFLNLLSGKKMAPYYFIGPAVLYLVFVTIFPTLMALPISFTDWTALSPKMSFVGLKNYITLFNDKEFYRSIVVMAQFFVAIPITMFFGLVIAMLLNNKLKGMTFFRVLFYSPVITSTIAVAILFDWFYQPSFGLFNSLLSMMHLPTLGWVTDPNTAALSVVILMVWKGCGASMLIYLAGLQNVQETLVEAAKIDGANWFQRFWHIVIPALRPATSYLIITGIIGKFMVFQETYMLKGPLNSTRTIVNYIYDKGFTNAEMGYASAMSFALFVVILIVTLVQNHFSKIDFS